MAAAKIISFLRAQVFDRWVNSQTFRWLVILSAILIALVSYLLSGTPPWDPELQARIEERNAKDSFWRAKDYGLFYGWWAALINSVILIGLMVTVPWWSTPRNPDTPSGKLVRRVDGENSFVPKWVFFSLLGLILLAAIYQRAPRLDHSFWHDEEYGFRKYTYGFHRPAKDKPGVEFKDIGWEETLFRNRLNNHILHSVSARAAHGIWEKTFKSEDSPPFREPVIRAVPFLCGIGSILATALLLGMLGHRAAGLAAAFFLAMNPWHMRFSVEARGYAYAMFFITLAIIFACLALRDGKWRNWLLFGACEACVFLSNLGCLFVLIILNLGLVLFIGLRKSVRVYDDRKLLFKRWLVVNTLAAMVVIQLVLPSVPQVRDILEGGLGLNASMGLYWWQEIWSLMAAGIDWKVSDTSLHHTTSAELELQQSTTFGIWLIVLFPILLIAGIVRSLTLHRFLFLAGMGTVGAAVVTWWTNESKDFFLHSWYINYALMGAAIFIGLGCGWIVTTLGRLSSSSKSAGSIAGIVIVALCLAVYALGTSTGREAMRENDRQPARQAIELIRGVSGPAPVAGDDAPIVGAFGSMWEMALSYQPELREVNGLQALNNLIEEARKSDRDLYVMLCGRNIALRDNNLRPVVEHCEDEALFEEEIYLPGMEEIYSYRIFKLRRG